MEKSRNEGRNPNHQQNTAISRDTSSKGREEQVVSQPSKTSSSDSSNERNRNESSNKSSDSSRNSMTTNSENISSRNPNTKSDENRRSENSGNDRGRQENLTDTSRGTLGRTQDVSSSNKEKGFKEGQQDNQKGLQSDTEIPKIGKDDAEKTQRQSPNM